MLEHLIEGILHFEVYNWSIRKSSSYLLDKEAVKCTYNYGFKKGNNIGERFILIYMHSLQFSCKVDNGNTFKIKMIVDLDNNNHIYNTVRQIDVCKRQ